MRPKVFINFAITADGRMANPDGSQLAISNEDDKRIMYQLRSSHDAILVGVNTVISDDPKLTVKEKYVSNPKNPARIVLDSNGRTPHDAIVLDGSVPTIIATSDECAKTFQNAEALRCGSGLVDLEKLMQALEEKGIQSIMVEGGPTVIKSFIEAGLADEVRVFVGQMTVGGEPAFPELFEETMHSRLRIKSVEKMGDGLVLEYMQI